MDALCLLSYESIVVSGIGIEPMTQGFSVQRSAIWAIQTYKPFIISIPTKEFRNRRGALNINLWSLLIYRRLWLLGCWRAYVLVTMASGTCRFYGYCHPLPSYRSGWPGGIKGDWTLNLLLAGQALSQLSYDPINGAPRGIRTLTLTGLKPDVSANWTTGANKTWLGLCLVRSEKSKTE